MMGNHTEIGKTVIKKGQMSVENTTGTGTKSAMDQNCKNALETSAIGEEEMATQDPSAYAHPASAATAMFCGLIAAFLAAGIAICAGFGFFGVVMIYIAVGSTSTLLAAVCTAYVQFQTSLNLRPLERQARD